MEITGSIYKVFDTYVVSDSFQKREFVIKYEENPEYPELLKLEMIQDKCSLLDDVVEGQPVTVSINLRGREYTKPGATEPMYFNTLQAWKITKGEKPQTQTEAAVGAFEAAGKSDTDLPF
jgi:hypothetical protein